MLLAVITNLQIKLQSTHDKKEKIEKNSGKQDFENEGKVSKIESFVYFLSDNLKHNW